MSNEDLLDEFYSAAKEMQLCHADDWPSPAQGEEVDRLRALVLARMHEPSPMLSNTAAPYRTEGRMQVCQTCGCPWSFIESDRAVRMAREDELRQFPHRLGE